MKTEALIQMEITKEEIAAFLNEWTDWWSQKKSPKVTDFSVDGSTIDIHYTYRDGRKRKSDYVCELVSDFAEWRKSK